MPSTGRQSLDELEAMAVSCFSKVHNQGLPPPDISPDVLLPEQLGKLLKARGGCVSVMTFSYVALTCPFHACSCSR